MVEKPMVESRIPFNEYSCFGQRKVLATAILSNFLNRTDSNRKRCFSGHKINSFMWIIQVDMSLSALNPIYLFGAEFQMLGRPHPFNRRAWNDECGTFVPNAEFNQFFRFQYQNRMPIFCASVGSSVIMKITILKRICTENLNKMMHIYIQFTYKSQNEYFHLTNAVSIVWPCLIIICLI